MSTKLITIAIIGFSGLIGRRHTKHVVDSSFTSLVALVDPSPAAVELAKSYPNVPLFVSVSEMLDSPTIPKPDAAIVCTPNQTHVPVGLELVAAGIHVLVEKPISTSIADGQKLVAEAKKHGVKVLVGHHRRFNPYVIATKKAIESGSLGDVTAVSALWTTFKPSEYFDANPALKWRSSKSQGGGVVLINFVHEIDLMHHFFGPTTRVHAEKTISRRKHAGEDDSVEEGVALTLRFESEVVGTFIISDHVVSPHNFEAGTGENPMLPRARRENGEEIDVYRIFGTEATLSVPDMVRWSYGSGKRTWERELIRDKVHIDKDTRVPFERQLDHLVTVVRGEEEPSCSGEAGLRAMIVCDCVRRALESESGTVEVPSIDSDLTDEALR